MNVLGYQQLSTLELVYPYKMNVLGYQQLSTSELVYPYKMNVLGYQQLSTSELVYPYKMNVFRGNGILELACQFIHMRVHPSVCPSIHLCTKIVMNSYSCAVTVLNLCG